MIDARRMEVYTSVFDKELNAIAPVEALVIDESSFESHADNSRLFSLAMGPTSANRYLIHLHLFTSKIFTLRHSTWRCWPKNYMTNNFLQMSHISSLFT
jgi:hypothetical protein